LDKNLNDIHSSFQSVILNYEKEIKEKQDQLDQKLAAERALKVKLLQDKQIKQEAVRNVNETDRRGISELALIEYNKGVDMLNTLRTQSDKTLNSNSDTKKYKFDLQKAINFPLNSMLFDKNSDENRRMFTEKVKTLQRLLAGQTCAINTTLTVNATKYPGSLDFCLVFFARKLVEKGEGTVASNPESSFQYVHLIIEICKQNSQFEDVITAQMRERCPYVVPFYKSKEDNQTKEEYFE
jgi:hypothetical protein